MSAPSSVRVLAVSDEVDEGLLRNAGSVGEIEVILACGDLPFEYLRELMDCLDRPLVFVPGNHDPDLSGYRLGRSGLTLRAGLPATAPWPPGAVNADGRIVEVAGLRIAGLGGSPRYTDGPNQYTQRQQARRARTLARRASCRVRRSRSVDVLLTHAPPLGVGDAEDAAHRGFECLRSLVFRLEVPLLLHGHVHPFGADTPDLPLGTAVVRNVVGRHVFDVPVPKVGARA